MGGVDAQHLLEMAAVDNQDPVEALAAQGADPTLGIGVRVWGSDGGVRMIFMSSLRKT
jgi:hypothetical protein